MHGLQEVRERCVDVAPLKLILIRISNGVNNEVEFAPLFFKCGKNFIQAFFILDIAIDDNF